MKVVINKCYGGFGLSKKAVMRYAELAGITLHHDSDGFCDHYHKVPAEQYKKLYEKSQRTRDYTTINGLYFSVSSIARNDPNLVQVVEELGEESWGGYAELAIVDIPDGVQWEIVEYDGIEHIAEVHRTWG